MNILEYKTNSFINLEQVTNFVKLDSKYEVYFSNGRDIWIDIVDPGYSQFETFVAENNISNP